ncbi:chromate efflux transporter [Pontibacter sp. JAM-7]|uniref:chromate efflux transporter n=1 Tax=Pontibacter sp. JAM-7 TaxID=3366581 RepID=UPI003AF8920B
MNTQPTPPEYSSALAIFWLFLRLGCTAFGGPIAHLAYFHEAFVKQKRWVSEQTYSELVALCQFLPGPASSQVGFALGHLRGGWVGAVAAWIGFTLPSVLILTIASLSLSHFPSAIPQSLITGLKVVAVAVIAQACLGMSRPLLHDPKRITLLILCATFMLLLPGPWTQLAIILLAGCLGAWFLPMPDRSATPLPTTINKPLARGALLLFLLLLLSLPILAHFSGGDWHLSNAFYSSGALVFGGGHVVLPLLDSALVQPGWLSTHDFLTGYGLAQAMPGPLFSVAAFFGAHANIGPGGVTGSLLAVCLLFLPGLLLVWAILPFWAALRDRKRVSAGLLGINAAVTGILLAALYQPVWVNTISGISELALAAVAFAALTVGKQPPWRVVLICPLLSWLLLG